MNNANNRSDTLLAALLEEFCAIYSGDKDIFKVICAQLSNTGVINNLSYSDKNSMIRHTYIDMLKKILKSNTLTEDVPIKELSRFYRDYTNIEILGHGGYGIVYKATHRLDGRDYAIKKVISSKDDPLDKVLREVVNLSKLNHENIVRYYGAWLEHEYVDDTEMISFGDDDNQIVEYDTKVRPCIFIQMELCDMTLKKWKGDYKDVFPQIVQGVKYIHAKGMIHRDLTPSNIFVNKDGSIKIGDLGLTRMIGDTCESGNKRLSNLTSDIGTFLYASPEQLRSCEYDFKTDIYSLGIILFELQSGFKTEMERIVTLTNLRDGIIPVCENKVLIIKMLSIDSNKRPNINNIII
jgi:serine/threonine protein kinase